MSNRMGTSVGPFYVGTEIVTSDTEGAESVETYQGSETECRNFSYVLKSRGATKLQIRAGPEGDWQVIGSFPFDADGEQDPIVDTMELDTNAVMRSVYQSPIFRSKFSDYSSTTNHSYRADFALGVVRDCSNIYLRGLTTEEIDYAYDNYTATGHTAEDAIYAFAAYRLSVTTLGYALSAGEKTAALNLLKNVAFRGVTSFLEYQQVFRRTVTAGSPNAVRTNYIGAGQIWTTAEVNAWENIPNDGWFVLPTGMQWHKDKPSASKAYGQKTQLTYHYTEIRTASALLYAPYGSATLID